MNANTNLLLTMSKNKLNIVCNNSTYGCIGHIDIDKYSKLLETNMKNAYMVLENNPNMIIRLGCFNDLNGKITSHTKSSHRDATIYLVENIRANSDRDPFNLSINSLVVDDGNDLSVADDAESVEDDINDIIGPMEKLNINDPIFNELYNLTDDDSFSYICTNDK